MRFDEQLSAYLYEYKSLRLEGIGTFNLDPKSGVPAELEKEHLPLDGLTFIYNPKATLDEDVITYLVKKLGKIQPLVRSDLESYISNMKQFINIGKPYTIEGIGTLSKNNQGTYEFTPGSYLPQKEELTIRRDTPSYDYPARSGAPVGRIILSVLLVLIGLILIGGLGYVIYNYTSRPGVAPSANQQGRLDTVQNDFVSDTVIPSAPVSVKPSAAAPALLKDTLNYKMVFETTSSRARAISRTSQLKNYRANAMFDSVLDAGTTYYDLYIPMQVKPADTLRVRDSLSKFLGRPVKIKQ